MSLSESRSVCSLKLKILSEIEMNLTDSLQFHLVVMQIVDSLSDKVATTLRTNQSKQNYDFQLTPLNCEMKVFRVVALYF